MQGIQSCVEHIFIPLHYKITFMFDKIIIKTHPVTFSHARPYKTTYAIYFTAVFNDFFLGKPHVKVNLNSTAAWWHPITSAPYIQRSQEWNRTNRTGFFCQSLVFISMVSILLRQIRTLHYKQYIGTLHTKTR